MRAYEKLPVAEKKQKIRAIPKVWKRYLDDSFNFVSLKDLQSTPSINTSLLPSKNLTIRSLPGYFGFSQGQCNHH